jgi:hypothetical protein
MQQISTRTIMQIRFYTGCARGAPASERSGQAGDDLTFAKKLAIANPDPSAELEILQKEIRRDRRGSLMIWKLVPLTITGLLIIPASSAY